MNALEKIAAAAYADEMETLWKLADADGISDPHFTAEKRAAYRALTEILKPEDLAVFDKLAWACLEPMAKLAFMGGHGRLYAHSAKTAGIWSGLLEGGGKLLGAGGRALGAVGRGAANVGSKLVGAGERAATGELSGAGKFLAGRGYNPGQVQGALQQLKTLGPEGYVRTRGMDFSRIKQMRGALDRAGAGDMLGVPSGGPNLRARSDGSFPTIFPGSSGYGSSVADVVSPASVQTMKQKAQQSILGSRGRAAKLKGPVGAAPTPEQAMEAAKGHSAWKDLRQGAYFGAGLGLLQRMTAPKEQPEVQYAY